MKKSRKLLALLLALILAFALAACGGSSGDSGESSAGESTSADADVLGVYKLQSMMGLTVAEMAEMTGDSEEEVANTMTLELKEGGKAEMVSDGDVQELEWTLDGEALTLTDGKEPLDCTLVDGVVTIADEGLEIVFVK